MSESLEKTRQIAIMFAIWYLEIKSPALVYRGKINTEQITGNYFTTVNKLKNPVTIVVNKNCTEVIFYIGNATSEDIVKEHSKWGAWLVQDDGRSFVSEKSLS